MNTIVYRQRTRDASTLYVIVNRNWFLSGRQSVQMKVSTGHRDLMESNISTSLKNKRETKWTFVSPQNFINYYLKAPVYTYMQRALWNIRTHSVHPNNLIRWTSCKTAEWKAAWNKKLWHFPLMNHNSPEIVLDNERWGNNSQVCTRFPAFVITF